ncbi:MAG TPA: hypothetical protein VLD35_01255 [Caldimonas sp.]|nr:hypothetical protein [Caldimonas sp.]
MVSSLGRRVGGVLAAVALVASPRLSLAQDAASATVSSPASHARIGVEGVRFPGDGPRVGLVGTTYLIDIAEASGLALGPAVYGAISGGHGGFFSLGGEVAWRHRLIGPVGVELGLYAGGGGGGGAPPGSGLMLRPHADLVWDFGAVAVGASISKVNFSGGKIDSNQVGLVLNINSDFRFVPAARLGEPTLGGGRAGLGFDRVQFVGGVYRTSEGKTLNDGTPLPRTIDTIGVRAEHGLGANAFWGLEANRAGGNGVGGYAEYLGTAGVEGEAVRDVLTVGARAALGMAGGGGVSTGGGLLVKGSVYGIVRLGNDLGLSLEAGVARAPDGNFRAAQGSIGLVWALDGPASGGPAARPARTDFSAGIERYDAPRIDGSDRALSAVALKLDRYLSSNFYVTGKVLSAVDGGASGYTSALVGAGWMQPIGTRLHVGAELLAGAGGGGGVAVDGALVEPRVFAGVQITPTLGLRAGAGRIRATDGRLDSTVFDVSLTLAYGLSSGH